MSIRLYTPADRAAFKGKLYPIPVYDLHNEARPGPLPSWATIGGPEQPIKPIECDHAYIIGRGRHARRYTAFLGVPGFKMCIRCHAVKIGLHSFTLNGNIADITQASVPATPGAGLTRLFTTAAGQLQILDSAGLVYNVAGISRVQGTSAETTSTSAAAVTLFSISTGISIPDTCWILLFGMFRKTSGNASGTGFGILLNATVIGEASSGALNNSGFGGMSATDRAETMFSQAQIPPGQVANYTQMAGGQNGIYAAGAGTNAGNLLASTTAARPAGPITIVGVRSKTGNAAITAGCTNLQILQMSVS